jgi:hypothetical protein
MKSSTPARATFTSELTVLDVFWGRKQRVDRKKPRGLAPCSICVAVIDNTPFKSLFKETAPGSFLFLKTVV